MIVRMKIKMVVDMEVPNAHMNDHRTGNIACSYTDNYEIERDDAIAEHYTEELHELEELIIDGSYDNVQAKKASVVEIFR